MRSLFFYLKSFNKFHLARFVTSNSNFAYNKTSHPNLQNNFLYIAKKNNHGIENYQQNFTKSNNSNQITPNLNIFLTKCKTNMYKGVELDLEKCNTENNELSMISEENFDKIILHSLQEWEKMGIRSLSIRIPINLTKYIKNFIDHKFYFHHTSEDSITVCRWLDETTQNKIPKFAHHHIGVGACIFNNKMEILFIREKYSTMNEIKNQPLWKLVTGLVEDGESIIEATHRETREEINLEINYHGCVMISERYPAKFNLTDLCFFSLCSLKNKEVIGEIEIDKSELTEAKFFDINRIRNIIEDKMCTFATDNFLKKILPWMDFNMTFEENIKKIEEEGKGYLITPHQIKDKNLKNFNMYW